MPNIPFGWTVLSEFQQLFATFILFIALALFHARDMDVKSLSALMIFSSTQSQDIHLTNDHDDESGNSVWHKRLVENLARFLNEKEI